MARVFNFSAGPSVLPEEVLKIAAGEMLDYQGTGTSVMEMSHRSNAFIAIAKDAETLLRELMEIPENYKVLFVQGGASTQFAMTALNLMGRSESKTAEFVNTGMWSKKAISEAKRFGEVKIIATSEDKNFSYIPELTKDMFDPKASYVHITANNTIFGTRYRELPDTGDVPLVTDMSSSILSERYDVTKFGLIYAGAQKNMGPAGVTTVIIREDLIGREFDITPTMLKYKIHAENESMYNTPPCYSLYIMKLVFDWLKNKGGVAAIQKINEDKAAILYDFLDKSKLFKGTVEPKFRSLMNVPFVLPSEDLNGAFIKQATAVGLINLKGHKSVGGMRASIYNAMPVDGVKKLVEFMKEFESKNG
ncbi:MAG: 3-phosphoserine/phosphohydroxythreonine transaminase [Chitinispirillales bacterium]|jgi:phosphoserine aminotransferase|nr:3-phosphoserine/phosphohydroxythreonine transaminase [Chitinispirillales bacterium]